MTCQKNVFVKSLFTFPKTLIQKLRSHKAVCRKGTFNTIPFPDRFSPVGMSLSRARYAARLEGSLQTSHAFEHRGAMEPALAIQFALAGDEAGHIRGQRYAMNSLLQ